MKWLSKLWPHPSHIDTPPMQHFLRVIGGPVDEEFQLKDHVTSSRIKEAYHNGEFFRFTTLNGRSCAINFRLVQAVSVHEAPEIPPNTDRIDGVQIYLANRDDYLIIKADVQEIECFLANLSGDDLIQSFGDWLFEKREIVIAVSDLPGSTTSLPAERTS